MIANWQCFPSETASSLTIAECGSLSLAVHLRLSEQKLVIYIVKSLNQSLTLKMTAAASLITANCQFSSVVCQPNRICCRICTGRCCMCTDQMAAPALFYIKWRHGRHVESVTSYQNPSQQSMQIYWQNNPAKFHPNKIWSDGALGSFLIGCPNKNNNKNKTSSDMRSVPDPKISIKTL